MTDTTRTAAATDAPDAPGEVSLGGVLRAGGFATLGTLVGLRVLDGLDGQALGLLAPEIKASLGIGDAVLGLIASLTTAVFVISAVPLGQLGDRTRRTTIAAVCAGLAAAAAAVTALVTAGWQLALARIGSGIGKSAVLPIHGSLLADRYAASGRNRVFAAHGLADPVAALLGPAVIALVASGGGEAWRRAFLVLAIPLGVLAVRALALPEPVRDASPPLSTAAAAARLRSIRSFSALLVGIGVVGFSLVAVPLFFSVLLDEKYGLSIFGRGLATSLTEIGAVAGSIVGGILGDRLVRRNPARVVVLVAAATAGYGVLFSLSVAFLPGLVPVLVGVGLAKAVLYAGTVPVYALVVALAPERLRALALALLGLSVFVGGGFLGGLITGIVSDAHGPGFALAVTTAPVCLIAALLVLPARRTIAADLVATASEATRDEVDAAADAARRNAGEPVPALAVRAMSAAYGPVPVLFDVDLDVMPGEIVALLGTNGAGKSTLLRAVSGLLPATGGTVRVNGTPVTWASTADRVQLGVVQVAGGRAVFPTLSVFDNLLAGCHTFAWDRARVAERIEASLARFPALADRADQSAGLLSGGEQQQLALAKALLLEPTVLLIDELSLGLSPIVVGELLGVVAEIAGSGVGVVLVEQSVNVALASATRAVFLERGRVRFSGPAHELSDRRDLLRAVFLGNEGG